MSLSEDTLGKLRDLRELLDDSSYITVGIAPGKKNAFLASRFVLEDEDIYEYIAALDAVLRGDNDA